jgi:hypothetical protein
VHIDYVKMIITKLYISVYLYNKSTLHVNYKNQKIVPIQIGPLNKGLDNYKFGKKKMIKKLKY